MSEGIYRVIGLERAEERQKVFYSQSYARKFTLFKAIDAQKANDLILNTFNFKKAFERYARQLTVGEAACTMSHQAVWRELASHPTAEYAVICEDDALFSNDIDILEDLIKEYSPKDKQKNIGILIFGESNIGTFNGILKYKLGFPMQLNPFEKIGKSKTTYKIGRLSSDYLCGTVGYIISKEWAQVLCNIEPAWLADDFPTIKVLGEGLYCKKLDIFHVRPRLVIENSNCLSSLAEGRREEQIKGWGPKKYSFTQLILIAMSSIFFYCWRKYKASCNK